MPASITLKHLTYVTADNRTLFHDLDLSFGPCRTALIGRNGVGKSTLLRLITGDLHPSAGEIVIEGSIGMLRQSVQMDDSRTVGDMLGVADGIARLARLGSGQGSPQDADEADWTLPGRIEATLEKVDLPSLSAERPLATLSGGQRTRLAVAALTLVEPDVILLDEPTNDLDAGGREALAALLRQWRGGAIVVSHDRELLSQMDAIVELTTLGAKTYGGNWQFYSERKAVELAVAEQSLSFAERNVRATDHKVQIQAERKSRKDGAATRKRSRNDMPKILLNARKDNAEKTSGENMRLANRLRSAAAEVLSEARAQVEILTPFSLEMASTGLPTGKVIVQCDSLTGGPVLGNPVIRDFSLLMTGPERLAVSGPNGSGKTTLLRLLMGQLTPGSGSVRIFGSYAFLDQTVSRLDPSLTVRDNFRALHPDTDENTCRAALARFMFRAEAALQTAGSLSGGEMLRAGLATAIGGMKPPQLVILDEPTNHLDIHAIEVVEAGLRAFDGALVVVSHDRRFLDNIGIQREIVLGGAEQMH